MAIVCVHRSAPRESGQSRGSTRRHRFPRSRSLHPPAFRSQSTALPRQEMVPIVETRRTTQWPGYSSGGSRAGTGAATGRYTVRAADCPALRGGGCRCTSRQNDVNAPLLRARVRGWRPRRFALQHRMELFMRPILLGMPRRDAFGDDAEPHPPDRQPRQAAPGPARQTGSHCRCGSARAAHTRRTRARSDAASPRYVRLRSASQRST